MSDDRFRETLALHVQACGYPLAAEVIRAGDELPDREPLAELPGQEALSLEEPAT